MFTEPVILRGTAGDAGLPAHIGTGNPQANRKAGKTIVRTRKFRSGREPPPNGLTWRRAGFGGQVPAAQTEQGDGQRAQGDGHGAQGDGQRARGDGHGAQGDGQRARGDGHGIQGDGQVTWDADDAMTALYQAYYRPLVQLAALLVTDLATAEDIVQESFAAVHQSWREGPGTGNGAALSYLRRSVVQRSRSATHRSWSATPHPAADGARAPGRPGDPGAGLLLSGSPVVSALRALPAPQREVMVLRYFAELSEPEIASATGMSQAAVRNHAAWAMSSLRAGLRSVSD
jgi:DNA-directed RNA polymerase specialized sigma24 family protein